MIENFFTVIRGDSGERLGLLTKTTIVLNELAEYLEKKNKGARDEKFLCDHSRNCRGELFALPLLLTTLSTNPSEDSHECGFYLRDAAPSRGGNATSEDRKVHRSILYLFRRLLPLPARDRVTQNHFCRQLLWEALTSGNFSRASTCRKYNNINYANFPCEDYANEDDESLLREVTLP